MFALDYFTMITSAYTRDFALFQVKYKTMCLLKTKAGISSLFSHEWFVSFSLYFDVNQVTGVFVSLSLYFHVNQVVYHVAFISLFM